MFHKILVLGEKPPVSYLSALKRVGLKFDCRFSVKDYSKYSGLLLIGGGDVLPAFYEKSVDAKRVNFIRDKAEFSALDHFISRALPVLCICRGAQVANVFLGGTLKCVNGHVGTGDEYATHSVLCDLSSPYYIGSVNSYHRQAIDKLADGGKVIMISDDGVIEAAEFKKDGVLCLQFHPEKMNDAAIDIFYGGFAKSVKKVSPAQTIPRPLRRY